MMDPGLKESILGDLRIANGLVLAGEPELGIKLLLIAFQRIAEGG